MIVRTIRPSDHEKIKALHGTVAAKYELPDFDSKNFVAGLVVVDEEDNPRVLLCFRRTAEAYVVVDKNFDAPAYRLLALGELIQAAKPLMANLGYEDVIGTIGPDVPKSYLKRLQRFGCGILENCTLVKMLREG
jgi:hypothetical protein